LRAVEVCGFLCTWHAATGSSARALRAFIGQSQGGHPQDRVDIREFLFRSHLRVSRSIIMSVVHATSEAAAFGGGTRQRFVRQLDMFLIASQGKKPLLYLKPILLDRTEGCYCLSKRICHGDNHLVMAMKLCTNSAAVEMVDDLSGPLPLHVAARYPVRTITQQWPPTRCHFRSSRSS
jgi:hypothetical protein